MRFMTNQNGSAYVFRRQSIERRQDVIPTGFPPAHDFSPVGSRAQFELLVAMTVGLLAI
jgi:hypothetical protein